MTKTQRQTAVRQAIANQRLEGGKVSKSTRHTMNDYIAGKMTAQEAAKQVYSRYGV